MCRVGRFERVTRGALLCAVIACAAANTFPVRAGPISFNSAVAEGVGIMRSQVRIVRKSGDSTAQNRDLAVTAIPVVLAYGVSPKLATFGVLPSGVSPFFLRFMFKLLK